MNKMLLKLTFGFLLCLVTFSAHALWKCQAINYRGEIWDAVFSDRSQAITMSLYACRVNSGHKARLSCEIDYCRNIADRYYRSAWQCNAGNIHGRTWFAIAGTRSYARYIALSYCKAYGRSPGTCYIKACFRK